MPNKEMNMCSDCGVKPAGLPDPNKWNVWNQCYTCWSYPYRITKTKSKRDVINLFK